MPDAAKTHVAAVEILAGAVQTVFLEGKVDQRFAVEVRDYLGPVLQVSAFCPRR